jgi:hypothetical protein
MKKIRNNIWNKIFHPKKLKAYKEWKEKAHSIIGWNKQLNEGLRRASSLQELINVHKHAWEIGYNNSGISPCPWGMFRCNSIPELTLDNLYLGDIWGLWTNSGKFWEEHRDENIGTNSFGIDPTKKIYDLIMEQYKFHLKSNINATLKHIEEELFNK